MENRIRGFEVVREDCRKHKGDIILPLRGTAHSAGYDFFLTEDLVIPAHGRALSWSDVKAYMQDGEVLELYVRSSIGIKKNLTMANTVGIIDKDYYSNESNDGNIGICLRNNSDEPVKLKKGERVAQGIFKFFLVSDNGNTNTQRTGGTGSTNS